jgi:hypothetical protein
VHFTVRAPCGFERPPQRRVKPALALQGTTAAPRAYLLPWSPRYEPAELVVLSERFAGHRLTISARTVTAGAGPLRSALP